MDGKSCTLPPKESSTLKRILRCYEQKMFKNGLKLTKQILGNPLYANHAETLAVKGLILNALGRREEGYEYVRRGLKNDLQSHTCWHVYGLIQRSERKYEEAVKCYRNALKFGPKNMEILRELSFVQIHSRDLKGYLQTRQQLFSLKPTQRASWIALAIAYHLLKDYDMAYKILEEYRKVQPAKDGDRDRNKAYETSELLLYQNTILQEKGDFQAALDHFHANNDGMHDKMTEYEYYGNIHYNMGNFPEAAEYFKILIQSNPDDVKYHEMYIGSLGIEQKPKEIVELYKSFEGCTMKTRIILKYAEGEEFLLYLRPFVRVMLAKGAPSLFTELRNFYRPEKTKLVENELLEISDQLERNLRFHEEDTEEAPPSALVWAYYYLAQHFDFLEKTETAMQYVDKAIDHTPTLTELFICKGKIHKHMAEFEKAAECLNEARELDTADRCINAKSVKYHLRANHIATATNIYGLFARDGRNPMEEANEMQCMWFQLECALAYQRTGQWGEALKKCHEIDRHFTDIVEDQYDFHTYCLRKMTLRNYIQLLRLEDKLRSHPFYFKAAKCAIEIYLHLFDSQTKMDETEQNNEDGLSAAEVKKLKNKMRRAQKKAEMEMQAATAAVLKKEQHIKSKQGSAVESEAGPKSEELASDKLAKTPDPLKEAIRFLEPLHSFAHWQIETHLLAYEICSRLSKPLLMLRSLKRAIKCAFASGTDNPTLAELVSDFKEKVLPALAGFPEILTEFVQEEMKLIKLKPATPISDGQRPTSASAAAGTGKSCWRKRPCQIRFEPRIYDQHQQQQQRLQFQHAGPAATPGNDGV